MRCHPQVCSSWRRLALANHENRNVYPTFEQFATFMDKVAREACDTVMVLMHLRSLLSGLV